MNTITINQPVRTNQMPLILTLFLIIFLEGYVVLSTELLAIRLLLPFTGNGTDTVSIIIAAILMPLAFGYFAGGQFRSKSARRDRRKTVRNRLIFNLVIAAAILTPGLSYAFLDTAFNWAYHVAGWNNRLLLTSVYSLLFLVVPVFLLGQTVPLISNYFSRERLPVMAGKILFFSTMGSFAGAVFCTLILMSFVGVHYTVSITIACMALLVFILSKKLISPAPIAITIVLLISLALNSDYAMAKFHIVRDNKYNTVQIIEHDPSESIIMKLNRSNASAVYKYSTIPRNIYISYIEDNFMMSLNDYDAPPRDILVLGAGGFTLGRIDDHNNFTFVDIDGDLKEIAENFLLKEKLGPNKKFIPMEARAFMNQTEEKFDMIVLDLYRDKLGVPEYLVTREFNEQVLHHLKPGGIMVGNYIASPSFSDIYTIKLDNTLRSVFPNLNRQIVRPYDAWNKEDWANIIYSYFNEPGQNNDIYTDNKNTSMFERPITVYADEKK